MLNFVSSIKIVINTKILLTQKLLVKHRNIRNEDKHKKTLKAKPCRSSKSWPNWKLMSSRCWPELLQVD